MSTLANLEFHDTDYAGRYYSDFFPARDPGYGPGWYVFGRKPEYGGHLIHLCGQPTLRPRPHPHYNCPVRWGFHTKREAQAVCDALNRGERP